MDKNWLIRTETNQLLGPVSKDKIKDLIDKKMLSDDDEITSGNGFWFYFREKTFVEEYIVQDGEQPFDPVSDATSIRSGLVKNKPKEKNATGISGSLSGGLFNTHSNDSADDEDFIAPEDSDLEYPDAPAPTVTTPSYSYPSVVAASYHSPSVSATVQPDEDEDVREFEYPKGEDLAFPDMELPEATSTDINMRYDFKKFEEKNNEEMKNNEVVDKYETDDEEEEFTFELNLDGSAFGHDDKEDFNYPAEQDLEVPVLSNENSSEEESEEKPEEEPEEEPEEGIAPSDSDLEFPE